MFLNELLEEPVPADDDNFVCGNNLRNRVIWEREEIPRYPRATPRPSIQTTVGQTNLAQTILDPVGDAKSRAARYDILSQPKTEVSSSNWTSDFALNRL